MLKKLIYAGIFLGITSGCTVTEFNKLDGSELLAVQKVTNNPVLKIDNADMINGNRYIKVKTVNGSKIDKVNGHLTLDKGKNYIKVECGRRNASIEEGQRLRFSEVHYFYAEPGQRYNVEYFSRAFDVPSDVSDIRYCSEDTCNIETGSDDTGAICNLIITSNDAAIKTHVFGQKRIY